MIGEMCGLLSSRHDPHEWRGGYLGTSPPPNRLSFSSGQRIAKATRLNNRFGPRNHEVVGVGRFELPEGLAI